LERRQKTAETGGGKELEMVGVRGFEPPASTSRMGKYRPNYA
jgi:hypothetical protein